MAKMYTLTEAQEQLGINPKTFRRWLEKANINPDAQVSHLDNRIKFLTEEQVTKLAHDHGVDIHAPKAKTAEIIPPGAYKLLIERVERLNTQGERHDHIWQELHASIEAQKEEMHQCWSQLSDHGSRIDAAEHHVSELQQQLLDAEEQKRSQAERLNALEEQLRQTQETIATLQAPKHATKAKSAPQTADTLPEGLIPWRPFADLHHVGQTTIYRHISNGLISVVHGRWKVGNGYVKELLDAQGQRDVWVQCHNNENFLTCDDCPHAIPE